MTLNRPLPLLDRLRRFAQAQPLEEIARQFDVIRRIEVQRRILCVVSYGVAAVFLPFWLCALLFVLDMAAEMAGYMLLRRLDPAARPGRYLAMLAAYLVAQVAYCAVPMLCWQLHVPMAQAFAIGTTMITLVQLVTMRSVHLPLGLAGVGMVILLSAIGNSWYWWQAGNPTGLAISSLCVAAGAWFAILALVSSHRLQQELVRGRAVAQAADLAKTRFLAQMSHELRTPLTAILGMGNAELLQADTPERRCRMQVLVQATEGLSVMLDDILDLSAVEAGQLPIRPRPMDLRAEVISIVDTYRQQALDAGLVLRCTLHESLPAYASLDGQRLRQCLSNLLSNAVKHTQAGMISVYAYEVHPGTLAFKVTDTGPGVAEELRDRIFEPFYRGPHNLPGTGLGMAISRTLARRMGGDLTLVPSATGAHFLLLLNYAPATVDDLPPRRTPQAGDLAGLRVLVVDDIATNRLVAATYLRLLGAEPVEAASGTAALAEVQGTRPPDIILLDLLMPDMDGPATLRALAQLETTGRHIPVIAMSADIIDQSRQDDLGRFDGFLRKPLGPETLAEVLAPFAAPRGQGNPPDPPSDRPAKSPD